MINLKYQKCEIISKKIIQEANTGTLTNKYQKYCGTCSHWKGDVEVKNSSQVEIKSTNVKCDKKNLYYSYSSSFGCSNWQQKFK